MNARTLMVLGFLTASLSACGVRDETMDGGSSASQTGTVTTTTGTTVATSTGSTTNPVTGSATGEEGTGNTVQLKFTDAYTGYWENETRSSSLTTEIVRLTYGERYYHIEVFTDQSSGAGTIGLNCYLRNGLSLTNLNSKGLRGAAGEDKTENYSEWTLEGSKLQSSIYDENGDLKTNSSGTATFKRVFTGLSVDDLQICS